MLHVVKLVQRRFPERAEQIATTFALLSVCALAIGIGLLILR